MASIVLPDADLDLAIPGVANAIVFDAGQVCIAGSRLYVHRSIHDRGIEGLAAYARGLTMGHGLDAATQMGPLVSARQAERIAAFVSGTRDAGATNLTGGDRSGDAGTFVAPAVIVDVKPDMEIVREEIFGPVLVAQAYDEIDEVNAAALRQPAHRSHRRSHEEYVP